MDVEEKKSMNGSGGESEQGWIERINCSRIDLRELTEQEGIEKRN